MSNLTIRTKTIASIALFTGALSTNATEVYVTRDADGNIIFSDQPQAGAETHKVKPIPTVPAFVAPKAEPETVESTEEETVHYTSLTIVTPQDQHHVPTGMAGRIEVSGVLSPGLEKGHTIQLLDNGHILKSGQQTHFSLEYLNRGEHKLQLRVIDDQDEVLIRSNNVTVYIERHSVLNRSNKNRRN